MEILCCDCAASWCPGVFCSSHHTPFIPLGMTDTNLRSTGVRNLSHNDAISNRSKGILHDIAAQVKAKRNIDMELRYITRKVVVNPTHPPLMETTLSLGWPMPSKVYGTGKSKKIAEKVAAHRALQHLKSLNVVTEDGRLSIKYGGREQRRNTRKKRRDCKNESKMVVEWWKVDRRGKRDKYQETGSWACRYKEMPEDVHHGSCLERGENIDEEMKWWNENWMDDEMYGGFEGEGAAYDEVVEDWWDREYLVDPKVNLDKLSNKKKKKGFSFIKGSILCSFGIIGLALYDINKHRGIVKNSRVGHLLLNIGAPPVVANSLSRAYYYQNVLLQWSRNNLPVYMNLVYAKTKPHILYAYRFISHGATHCYQFFLESHPPVKN